MAQVPQHPANVAPEQQGLGAPVAQSNSNQYFVPNQALQSSNSRLEAAQAQQAQAQAQKAYAESALIQQAGTMRQGLGLGTPAPVPMFKEVAQALVSGSIDTNGLQSMVQAGKISANDAHVGMQLASEYNTDYANNSTGGMLEEISNRGNPQLGLGSPSVSQ